MSVEGGLRGVQNFAILAEMKPKGFLHLPVWPEKSMMSTLFLKDRWQGEMKGCTPELSALSLGNGAGRVN